MTMRFGITQFFIVMGSKSRRNFMVLPVRCPAMPPVRGIAGRAFSLELKVKLYA